MVSDESESGLTADCDAAGAAMVRAADHIVHQRVRDGRVFDVVLTAVWLPARQLACKKPGLVVPGYRLQPSIQRRLLIDRGGRNFRAIGTTIS